MDEVENLSFSLQPSVIIVVIVIIVTIVVVLVIVARPPLHTFRVVNGIFCNIFLLATTA